MVRGIRSAGREVENLPHDPSCADESNLLNGIASVRGVTPALSTELGARLHIGLGETRAPVTHRLTCRGHHLAGMVPSHPTRVKFLFYLDPARWRAGPLAPQSHFTMLTMDGLDFDRASSCLIPCLSHSVRLGQPAWCALAPEERQWHAFARWPGTAGGGFRIGRSLCARCLDAAPAGEGSEQTRNMP